MNQLKKWVTILGLASGFAAVNSFGQIYRVDEYGGAVGLPPGVMAPDPSFPAGIGLPGAVMVFPVPFPVVPGDVLLTEEPIGGQTNSIPSDVLRFWQSPVNPNQYFLIFYSESPEAGEPFPPPADVGLPTQLQTVFVGPFPEVGTDAFNSASYLALPGMPGWDGTAAGTSYEFISDGRVPEPSTSALAGLTALLLLSKWRRRR